MAVSKFRRLADNLLDRFMRCGGKGRLECPYPLDAERQLDMRRDQRRVSDREMRADWIYPFTLLASNVSRPGLNVLSSRNCLVASLRAAAPPKLCNASCARI